MVDLDVGFVRSQFPAFSEKSLNGWAFFENAGGSYTCRQVVDKLHHFYTKTKVQPYLNYPASILAGEAMDESYKKISSYLNIGEDELHIGPSTSQNTYTLSHAMAEILRPGDEIICSNQDHEANAGVWRRMAKAQGVTVKEWEVDKKSGMLEIDQLKKLLSPKVRLLTFPHCSNVVGHVNDVKEVAKMAKPFGTICVVDGVSYAPHGLPNLGDLGADIYLFSAYKTFGPHLGIMYVKREVLDRLPNQGHYFNADMPTKKLVPAGPDHAQIACSGGMIDYMDTLYEHHFGDGKNITQKAESLKGLTNNYEKSLIKPLLGWISDRSDLDLLGPVDENLRVPTLAVRPLSKDLDEVQEALTNQRIMVGSGNFYAVRVLEAMGIDPNSGVLRLSFVHYNEKDEVLRLIEALENVLG